jgi:hypothetical protein
MTRQPDLQRTTSCRDTAPLRTKCLLTESLHHDAGRLRVAFLSAARSNRGVALESYRSRLVMYQAQATALNRAASPNASPIEKLESVRLSFCGRQANCSDESFPSSAALTGRARITYRCIQY